MSPLADGGYDVADYRAIDPLFGTLAEAEALIAEALTLGHPDDHRHRPEPRVGPAPVVRGLRSPRGPGSPERARFWFRPGQGRRRRRDAERLALQLLGDTAWTRTTEPGRDARRVVPAPVRAGTSPTSTGTTPTCGAEHEDILRFWFDRGAARRAHRLRRAAGQGPGAARELPDPTRRPAGTRSPTATSCTSIYREWRAIADDYEPARASSSARSGCRTRDRFARYLRPDELHSAFNFDFLAAPWDADALRASIDGTLAAHAPVGATADLGALQPRRHPPGHALRPRGHLVRVRRQALGTPTDLGLGERRARAAALLTAALPGSLYVYQGDELGLPEVEDLPAERIQDPMHFRSGGVDPGRDGCRVPLPWSGDTPPFGFSPPVATDEPWLPQPAGWAALTVERQAARPGVDALALPRDDRPARASTSAATQP